MKTFQSVIKYLSLALSLYLIVSLFELINMFINKNNNYNSNSMTLDCNLNDSIDKLDIDLDISNLTIKYGSNYKIETNNKIKCISKNNKLGFTDSGLNHKIKDSLLVITIKENKIFNEIDIESDLGNVNIDELKVNKFDLNIDLGNTIIKSLESKIVDIETDAGNFELLNGNIDELKVSSGFGKSKINTRINRLGLIKTGAGFIDLNLFDNISNYSFNIKNDVGTILLNNKKITDKLFGNGNSKINIKCDLGKVNINTKEM